MPWIPLGKSKYLAGDKFTLADINLFAILDPSELGQIDTKSYSNIVKWRNELKSQDWYQKCYKDFTQYVQEAMSAGAS